MKTLHAIRSEKRLIGAGDWHRGKITRVEFPLRHAGPTRISNAWHWSVRRVADDQNQYRILVAFDPGKLQYWAWLALVDGDDQALIARVEFHASHDGWHCHWKTGLLAAVSRGVVKAGSLRERRHDCGGDPIHVSKTDAFRIAFDLFNVSNGSSETLL